MPKFLSAGEKRVLSAAFVLALFAALALGFQFVSLHQTSVPAIGGTYTEGLVGTPTLINPLYASASDVDNDLAHLVYSGLMRFDPQSGLGPDLASSYTMSADGKSYTFILKDGITFHNGDPLSSADVLFTFSAIQNPDYASPLAPSFSGVSVETPDERTVTFTLPEPSASFLQSLTVGILPSQVWSDITPTNARLTTLNLKPIGTGPYKFAKLTKDSRGTLRSMTFERNKDFYRGAPYISELQFKFTAGLDELPGLLRNKNIEGAVSVPFTDAPKFLSDHAYSVFEPAIPEYTAALFNLKSTGPIADPNVRKALDLSVDRQTLVTKALLSQALPLSTPLVAGMPGAQDPSQVSFDAQGAVAALDASGYKLPDGGGVRTKGTAPLALTVTFANTPELQAVANELKRQWELLGMTINLSPKSADELQTDTLRNRNFDILLAGELYGAFRDPYPYWHSSQTNFPGLNVTGFVSRAGDDAIAAIRSTPDDAKRSEAYGTLMKAITDSHAATFLYEPSYVYVTSHEIKGIELPFVNLPSDRFANVNAWYIKTKRIMKK